MGEEKTNKQNSESHGTSGKNAGMPESGAETGKAGIGTDKAETGTDRAGADISKEAAGTSKADEYIFTSKYVRLGVTVFVTFVGCILFFFFLLRYQGFASIFSKLIRTAQPILIGLVIAYILSPLVRRIEKLTDRILSKRKMKEKKRKKTARAIAVILSVLVFFVIIAFLIAILVPTAVNSTVRLVETLQIYTGHFIEWIDSLALGDEKWKTMLAEVIQTGTTYVQDWFTNSVTPQAEKYITGFTSGIISIIKGMMNFVIGIIIAVYVLCIQEKLTGQFKKLIYSIFYPKAANAIIETLRKSNTIFGGFIIGKIIDSMIIGIISYIGCTIMRIPDATLVSIIIGVTNVIPFFGPFVGAVPALLLVVIQSPIHALYLVIFIIVLQQLDGNVIGPSILGNTTGLSSFWVLFAILISGGLYGFAGMLLGVPTFGVIYYIVRRIMNRVLQKRKLPLETEKYIELIEVDEKTREMIYTKRDNE